jgi:hypothetical protein
MSCYITILSIIFLCTYLDLFMEFDYMMLALASINLLLQCYGQLSFHKPWEKWQDWSWCVERHIYIFIIFIIIIILRKIILELHNNSREKTHEHLLDNPFLYTYFFRIVLYNTYYYLHTMQLF